MAERFVAERRAALVPLEVEQRRGHADLPAQLSDLTKQVRDLKKIVKKLSKKK